MLHPLLGKLYESYKRDIIQSIRHDEQEYHKKVDEIKEIEEGKWGDNELLREMGREQQVLEIQRLQLLRQMRLEMAQKQLRLEKRSGLNYHANSSQQHQAPNQVPAQTNNISTDTTIKSSSTSQIAATRSLSPERNIQTKIDQQKEERSKSESPTLSSAAQNTKVLQHQQLQQQLQQHKLQQLQQQQLQQQQLQKQQLIQQQLKQQQQQQQKVLQLQQALAQAQKVKTEQKPEEKIQEVKQAKSSTELGPVKLLNDKKPVNSVGVAKKSDSVTETAVANRPEHKLIEDVANDRKTESKPVEPEKKDIKMETATGKMPKPVSEDKSEDKQTSLLAVKSDQEAKKEEENQSNNLNGVKLSKETPLPTNQKEVKFAEKLEEVKTLSEETSEEEPSQSIESKSADKIEGNPMDKLEKTVSDEKDGNKEKTEQLAGSEKELKTSVIPTNESKFVGEKLVQANSKAADETVEDIKESTIKPEKPKTTMDEVELSPSEPNRAAVEISDVEKNAESLTEPEEIKKTEVDTANKHLSITEVPGSFSDASEVQISENFKPQESEKNDSSGSEVEEVRITEALKEDEPVNGDKSLKKDNSDAKKPETAKLDITVKPLKAEKPEGKAEKEVEQTEVQIKEIKPKEKEIREEPTTKSSEDDNEKVDAKSGVDSEASEEPEEPREREEHEDTDGEEEKEEEKPGPELRVTRSTARILDKEAAAATAEATRPTVRTRSSSRVRNKTPEVKEEKSNKEGEKEKVEKQVQEEEEEQDDMKSKEEPEESEEPEVETKLKGHKRAAVEKRESARLKKAKIEDSVEKTPQTEQSALEESEVEETAAKEEDNKIKKENKETDNETQEEEDHDKEPEDEEEEADNDDSPGPPTKRTRSMSSAKKRKRQSSPPRATPNRRFLTMVNPLLSNISSNKSASFFSNPVNPNDAPNYYDLIYDPTDIRTIKAQVKDGRIRDTAELERELQRMFANAVMYNGWDSDVSMWTREMQHDTETLLALFRGAERTSAVNSEKSSVASGDEDSSKRRKK